MQADSQHKLLDAFSPSYEVARDRFRQAALRLGARIDTHTLDALGPTNGTLTIDVAIVGDAQPQSSAVVSSGLHGVEGFFGSAVQLAWLQAVADGRTAIPARSAVTLVHAVNPFGFAWRRRANEDNVDLNRNFLRAGEFYAGASSRYGEFDGFLNPPTPPSLLEPFPLKVAWHAWRFGMVVLRNGVAVGQYAYPTGLFFGGSGPSQSARIMQQQFWEWVRPSRSVVHVDLHTGLGRSQRCQLLVEPVEMPHLNWYRAEFGADDVVSVADEGVYQARGVMGAWLSHEAEGLLYRFICAEFGTYSMLRVLGALRAENRAHHHGDPDHPVFERAKRELVECFCPVSSNWRGAVVQSGMQVIVAAVTAARRLAEPL